MSQSTPAPWKRSMNVPVVGLLHLALEDVPVHARTLEAVNDRPAPDLPRRRDRDALDAGLPGLAHPRRGAEVRARVARVRDVHGHDVVVVCEPCADEVHRALNAEHAVELLLRLWPAHDKEPGARREE